MKQGTSHLEFLTAEEKSVWACNTGITLFHSGGSLNLQIRSEVE